MTSREIVKRAIEFRYPPRLPFWQHGLQNIPDDICECAEMDRAKSGWFFGESTVDDWGCGWQVTEGREYGNMGQVVHHPLQNRENLKHFRPPNPHNSFCFERIEPVIHEARGRYVMLTSHFNLFERLHMLRGFTQALEDFYMEPGQVHFLLDLILEFKLGLLDELHRRFTSGIDGVFFTDDWGTQSSTFVSRDIFKTFFYGRYKNMIDQVHACGWHFILHTDGRVNEFIPLFIELGVDVLNLLQPPVVGIKEIGENFAGKISFLTMPDIQQTLPLNNPEKIINEARQLVSHWATPAGGLIVANCGDGKLLGMNSEMPAVMYQAFAEAAYPD